LTQLSDNELANLIKQDDPVAFNELYERYWDKLFYVAYKRLKIKEVAEEVVQETFMAIWERRHEQSIADMPAYLSAVARYMVFHHIAKQQRARRHIGRIQVPVIEDNLEERVDNKILLQIIHSSTKELPEKCRLVFQYNKQQHYSIQETAEKLGISTKTAEGHLTKALKFLRAKLVVNSLFIIIFLFK
jgi:RNA polymerase sigma-70 factor (ECF subfamily)